MSAYEKDFEANVIKNLISKGWESRVLKYCSQEDLIKNWADIIFNMNREADRLNNCRLTRTEMQQIIDKIEFLRTPINIHDFINGMSTTIIRDNPEDTVHFGQEVCLELFDPREISAGRSRYQIAEQPVFAPSSKMIYNRRGDILLLINGMPLYHIELKSAKVPLSEACYQIEKYAHEGIYTGIFSLIQIFVAMTPNESVYFANPGPDGEFNKSYYFHWANFNNEPINHWKDFIANFLSIPMAHLFIGFYTIADRSDNKLKVVRSYQYYAINAISDKVSTIKWGEENQYGGYIWHTTGSGKTLTSFVCAQLIARSYNADKVIFLTDRVELGTQSFNEYRGFANDDESVQKTENTRDLVSKIKSSAPADTLIVTSIQKMSNIKEDSELIGLKDIETMNKKRIVFIIDECHRSTFGEMLVTIKGAFPKAIFFGFTGTPIKEENSKKLNTTATIFGNELHRYSIRDGIQDKNVLGFDVCKVSTFKDKDLRTVVALDKANAASVGEAVADETKAEIYQKYMSSAFIKMGPSTDEHGNEIPGIESFIPPSQYETEEHRNAVVEDIISNFSTISRNHKFHSLFTTRSINEAIAYYKLIKEKNPNLKVTCLFDHHIDNNKGFKYKEDGLIEILTDYNNLFGTDFTVSNREAFKKDVALRLSHKEHYRYIETAPEQQLDLLIVVDQMLTGFDSKWVNCLYIDKLMQYENIIQSFSRTNRLFGADKPFGIIRYYRYPNTMEYNIKKAVKLYSGDEPLGLFVNKLPANLHGINDKFSGIEELFNAAGIKNFEKLPDSKEDRTIFAIDYAALHSFLTAASIQGFSFDKSAYTFVDAETRVTENIEVKLTEDVNYALFMRYKELKNSYSFEAQIPYELSGYLTEIDTGVIDAAYMNTHFEKYLKILNGGSPSEDLEKAYEELCKTFSALSQEEQRCAKLFLHDIQRGDVVPEAGKTFKEYIAEYQVTAYNNRVRQFSAALGLNEELLREVMVLGLTKTSINEFGRLSRLRDTIDKKTAKDFFEKQEGKKLPPPKINIKIDNALRDFVLSDSYSFDEEEEGPEGGGGASNMERVLGWCIYFTDKAKLLQRDKCGKWMCFFSDQKFAMNICDKAIKEEVCYECKCTDMKATGHESGVICFYVNSDDIEGHRKIIQFMLNNELIRKTKTGKLYNISFKFDSQTRAKEYGADFEGAIKLEQYVDLNTGKWIA